MGDDIITLIKDYLKLHLKSFIVFCLFAVVFSIVFWLYRLSVQAVLYAVLLCCSIWIVIAFFDFLKFYKHHKKMVRLKDTVLFSIEELPISKNLIERDYTKLINIVQKEKERVVCESDMITRDMTEYYALWVHQIKTPIAAMRLLLQTEDNDSNNELLSELFKIEQYVDMVLSYVRLSDNASDFVIKRYSLDDIVKQAVHKYAPLFIRKKLALDFKALTLNVLTDEKWLLFVIEQILSNALKYTNEGSISIYVSNNSTLVIEDTGIGIAAEDIPRLGDKGFTGYNGREYKRASGIGLFLCKKILNKLSHTIIIESTVGLGTRVLIGLGEEKLLTE